MKALSGCIVLGVLSIVPLWVQAAPLQDLLGKELAARLQASGEVRQVQSRESEPALLLQGSLEAKVAAALDGFEPDLLVEALYLYRKPATANGEQWTEAERTALYNALSALSTLQGIQYYSASRERMRTFYESSYLVAGPGSWTRVKDPVVTSPPEKATLYAVQRDLTLGEHRYRYDFRAAPDAFLFVQENLTDVNVVFVPVLRKGGMRTAVLVADAGPWLVVYAASAARIPLVPGIESRLLNSFNNRTDALYRWFCTRAETAFQTAQVP